MNANPVKFAKFSIWGLLGISLLSCLARNDFNVLACVFVLGLLASYYEKYKQTSLKIAIQLLAVVIIVDLVWVIIISFAWKHNSSDSDFWKSLGWIHGMVYFLAFFEMIFKGVAIFFLVKEFKLQSPMSDLGKINYFEESKMNENK